MRIISSPKARHDADQIGDVEFVKLVLKISKLDIFINPAIIKPLVIVRVFQFHYIGLIEKLPFLYFNLVHKL